MRSINVSAPDVSAAWVGACEAMMDGPAVAYHTVVRIEVPWQRTTPSVVG